jgi:hypothetical protein
MKALDERLRSPLAIAMVGSAVVGAQFIASKAARDALFLANFDTASLPSMVMVTALFSIALVLISSRLLARIAPEVWVPAALVVAAALMLAEWLLMASASGAAARILYLQVSGIGPLLGSGFWLIASERFDPRTAKQVFGRIAAAGTIGGLLGGLAAARVAAVGDMSAMLPMLAALNLVCAWVVRRLSQAGAGMRRRPARAPLDAETTRSGLRVLREARYLRNLALLVLLGTTTAIFVDQVFKTEVKATFGRGPSLGRFFSYYYAALSLLTFIVQAAGSRVVLEKFGLSAATGTPAATFLLGGAATLLAPGLRSLALTRGTEAVFRNSIYRAGYELFYTPIQPRDKRAVKSVIDVGADRMGDVIGAAITQALLWMPQPAQSRALLALAMGCSVIALFVSRQLRRGYSDSLEKSLLSHGVEMDLSDAEDLVTKTTILHTQLLSHAGTLLPSRIEETESALRPIAMEPEIRKILTLQSGDRYAILRLLKHEEWPSAALVPHLIALLGVDDLSAAAVRALRTVAEERVGALVDALIDPTQPFAVRRRIPRVLSVCVSQRATDGLMLGLDDLRFEVRFQCGRSLFSIIEKNPGVQIDKASIFRSVLREVSVTKEVWDGRRLLDGLDEGDDRSFMETMIGERVSQTLAHVFTLLALVLPTEPLRIAYRGLHTDDQRLRGTALEYLESVLPREIRDRLWPFIASRRLPARPLRAADDTLADLMQSSESIMVNLEALKKRLAGESAT